MPTPGRFIPLSSLGRPATPSAGGGGFDPTSLLRYLKPAGTLANLAGFGTAGSALGAAGGLAGLGANLAGGNYTGALTSLPSLAGGLGKLASSAGFVAAPTAAEAGAVAAGTLAPTFGTALSGLSAAALPITATLLAATSADSEGLDVFDALFGGAKTKAQKQIEEYGGYRDAFPGLVGARTAGAGLFDDLDTFTTPEGLSTALDTAHRGIRATDLSPAYSHLLQAPDDSPHVNSANLPSADLSWWEDAAPALEGENWGAYTRLMDTAATSGLDTDPIAGRRNRAINLGQGLSSADVDWSPDMDEADLYTSQEAYDLSNAIAGIGGQLGIDWGARGPTGRDQGYELRPEDLEGLGFTQGNYMSALADYLQQIQPDVTQHANWSRYFG